MVLQIALGIVLGVILLFYTLLMLSLIPLFMAGALSLLSLPIGVLCLFLGRKYEKWLEKTFGLKRQGMGFNFTIDRPDHHGPQ